MNNHFLDFNISFQNEEKTEHKFLNDIMNEKSSFYVFDIVLNDFFHM